MPGADRKDFLLEMYRQTSAHLNRHILLSWQSIGVVAGAFAVFVLGDKAGFADARLDFAVSVVVLLCLWSAAHIFDANNWFERNLHLITNIERQFLNSSDLREIHYFFEAHRRERSAKVLIKHFEIQLSMAVVMCVLVLLYHFYERVVPGLESPLQNFQWNRCLPYLVGLGCGWYCARINRSRKKDYEKLLARSPGKIVAQADAP